MIQEYLQYIQERFFKSDADRKLWHKVVLIQDEELEKYRKILTKDTEKCNKIIKPYIGISKITHLHRICLWQAMKKFDKHRINWLQTRGPQVCKEVSNNDKQQYKTLLGHLKKIIKVEIRDLKGLDEEIEIEKKRIQQYGSAKLPKDFATWLQKLKSIPECKGLPKTKWCLTGIQYFYRNKNSDSITVYRQLDLSIVRNKLHIGSVNSDCGLYINIKTGIVLITSPGGASVEDVNERHDKVANSWTEFINMLETGDSLFERFR